MIQLSVAEAMKIHNLLESSLIDEECFANDPTIGEDCCFHCQVNNGMEIIETACAVESVCYRCGQHFAVHNDDGSCIQE